MNSLNLQENAPLRRRVKTAVIPVVFIGSGARFLPRTPQNRKYLVFSWNSLKYTKFHIISWNSLYFN